MTLPKPEAMPLTDAAQAPRVDADQRRFRDAGDAMREANAWLNSLALNPEPPCAVEIRELHGQIGTGKSSDDWTLSLWINDRLIAVCCVFRDLMNFAVLTKTLATPPSPSSTPAKCKGCGAIIGKDGVPNNGRGCLTDNPQLCHLLTTPAPMTRMPSQLQYFESASARETPAPTKGEVTREETEAWYIERKGLVELQHHSYQERAYRLSQEFAEDVMALLRDKGAVR